MQVAQEFNFTDFVNFDYYNEVLDGNAYGVVVGWGATAVSIWRSIIFSENC